MPVIASYQKEIIARVLPIVQRLIRDENLFEELDKDKTSQDLVQLIEENFSPEEFRSIADDDLSDRIDGVMGIEVLANLLSDWTEEEKTEFVEAMPKRSNW